MFYRKTISIDIGGFSQTAKDNVKKKSTDLSLQMDNAAYALNKSSFSAKIRVGDSVIYIDPEELRDACDKLIQFQKI